MSMSMKESEIEARLVRGVKALGGVAYKFIRLMQKAD